ncbi:SDR family oxidoreductase [Rhodococcus sp. RS1C4]|nr:glucose 1-dehydrogenase [Rhodococcus sp. RS1C4]OZC53176.1 SDR family oxidoreductase [Rhodococcus sp. RS1C4]
MKGRTALVTGAGAGMGNATALAFAREGPDVVAADLDETAGKTTVAEIEALGARAEFVQVDVADSGQIHNMVDATISSFGRLDFAVSNAAIAPDRHCIVDVDEAEFARMLTVNLTSVLLCMKFQIRAMLDADRGGSIVNIGSVRSLRALAGSPGYTATKHAVVGLSNTAALEYASAGIRVNTVCPGPIDTPMLRQARARRGETAESDTKTRTPLGRLGAPDEVARTSLWLCSDAASFVTGQTIAVDGGFLTP